MRHSAIELAAVLIGVIAGLRTFTAPAAVSWAAYFGALEVKGTWLAFLGFWLTPWIFTALALVELVADQLPRTPSRKTPMQFTGRLVSGALCGAAVGTNAGSWPIGIVAGVLGAIVGTLGGYDFRMWLSHAFRRDMPAAFVEDAIAIGGAIALVAVLV